jgi:hypothetical protein
MISSANSSIPPVRPLPKHRVRNLWLWPQPALPGFYGNSSSGRIWITTNHLPAISSVNQPDTLVLALEAGGLHPTLAAAFDPALIENAREELESLTLMTNSVQVDPALARRFIVEKSSSFGQETFTVSGRQHTDRSQIGMRLFGAFLLILGQALVFVWPLLLFG